MGTCIYTSLMLVALLASTVSADNSNCGAGTFWNGVKCVIGDPAVDPTVITSRDNNLEVRAKDDILFILDDVQQFASMKSLLSTIADLSAKVNDLVAFKEKVLQSCETGKFVSGYVEGVPVCSSPPAPIQAQTCGDGTAFVGIDSNGDFTCESLESPLLDLHCDDGSVVTGISNTGTLECKADSVAHSALQTCGSNQFVTGVDTNGEVKCGDVAQPPVIPPNPNGDMCGEGKYVMGVTEGGELNCAEISFPATPSGQCETGSLVAGFGDNASLICAQPPMPGSDLAGLSCTSETAFISGFDADDNLVCKEPDCNCETSTPTGTEENPSPSCNDIYETNPSAVSGWYYLALRVNGVRHNVLAYCLFKNDGTAWTLVESYSYANRGPLAQGQMVNSAGVNKNGKDLTSFGLSGAEMLALREMSPYYGATCNMDHTKTDDYFVNSFANLDPLDFDYHSGVCMPTLEISVRGHKCTDCLAMWWQSNSYKLHVDSSHQPCNQGWRTSNPASSEDNFGYYGTANSAFSCTASGSSTTNFWFGGKCSPGTCASTAVTTCGDLQSLGVKSGWYYVNLGDATPFSTYCDFSNGGVWTLIRSFQLANKATYASGRYSESTDSLSLRDTDYSVSAAKIAVLKSKFSFYRATCNMDLSMRDNFFVNTFENLDMLDFDYHSGTCKMTEELCVRGVCCSRCSAKWWQSASYPLTLDSTPSLQSCGGFAPTSGVYSEDNWGHYGTVNAAFPCSASSVSTTNWWVGDTCVSSGAQSCAQLPGGLGSGWYCITLAGKPAAVYCDMSATPPWTLVRSFSLANAAIFRSGQFKNSPGRNLYGRDLSVFSLTGEQMQALHDVSTQQRATCNMDVSETDDYFKAKFTNLDMMTAYADGGGACFTTDRVCVRGTCCSDCSARWWQSDSFPLTLDSSSQPCGGLVIPTAVSSEDNWGHYGTISSEFSCTASQGSTTNWWMS